MQANVSTVLAPQHAGHAILQPGGDDLEETAVRGLQPGALTDEALQPLRTAAKAMRDALQGSDVVVPGASALLAACTRLQSM
jgi:hypothetical protein